jgi:hypothetical protein
MKRYRIKAVVRPYAGRILYAEYEEATRVAGRIVGATATRWYFRDELEELAPPAVGRTF